MQRTLFPTLSLLPSMKSSLKRVAEMLKRLNPSRSYDISKLFSNRFFIPPPKVLEKHDLSCEDLIACEIRWHCFDTTKYGVWIHVMMHMLYFTLKEQRRLLDGLGVIICH